MKWNVLLCIGCLVAYGADSRAELIAKDSITFTHRYEANSELPTVEDPGSGWTLTDNRGDNGDKYAVSDGALSYSTTEDTGGRWYESLSQWDAEVGTDTSWTVEVRAKVTASSGSQPGLHVAAGSTAHGIWLDIATDAVQINSTYGTVVTIDSLDNATDFHTYRLACDETTDALYVWRDGVSLTDGITVPNNTRGRLLFGDASSNGHGAAAIDYFRWDTGAYSVPEPGTLGLMLVAVASSSLFYTRRRRAA